MLSFKDFIILLIILAVEELLYFNTITAEKGSYLAQFKPHALFQSLTKAAFSAAAKGKAGAFYAAAKELVAMVKKQEDKVEVRVFYLFANALRNACLHSFLSPQYIDYTLYNHQVKSLVKNLEEDILTLEISLTLETLTNFAIHQSPALLTILKHYQKWLVNAVHLKETIAKGITEDVQARFLDFLDKEWASDPTYYSLIEQSLKTPFSKQRLENGYLLNYYEELKQLYHQPALGDKLLPLSKIYQEPDFLVYEECLKELIDEDDFDHRDGFVGTKHLYSSLHQYLEDWLNEKPSEIQIKGKQFLILLGQPGKGKSSFCYRTLSQLLDANSPQKRVYFVRLRDLKTKEQLIQEPFAVLEDYLKKKTKLSTISIEESILILDGLDELYMSEGLTNENLKVFYEKLEHEVEQEKGLQLILTSRYNYLNIEAIDKDITTVVKLAPLSLKKQKQWLSIYKEAHKESTLTQEKLEEIDEDDQLKHIKELIEQPILLHLIAQSGVAIDGNLDRAKIYEQLFATLIYRKWEEKQLKQYKGLSKKKHQQLFKQWLKEIAYNIHQSDQGYIHQHQIEALDSTTELNNALETPIEIEDAMKNLLVAFYFRNVAEETISGNHPVEFLHLSLQEYLAAEYTWNEIVEISKEGAKTDVELFQIIFELFHRKGLNENMSSLLLELIEQEEERTKLMVRARWRKVLPLCLKHQFLYNYEIKGKIVQPLISIRNSFKSFWLILSSLAMNKEVNRDLIEENYRQDLATLVRTFGGYSMQLCCLDLMDANLMDANLRSANLRSANLMDANLRSANLRSANLRSANLRYANLIDAKLMYANLRYAKLMDAKLIDAKLMDANLRSANLRSANLMYAKLMDANLRSANLMDANLMSAKLMDAKLMSANLRYANLMDAKLMSANLMDANLIRTDLRGADLGEVKTENPNFFQTLKQQNCIGVEDLEEKYQVDPTPNYEKEDTEKQHPYYIIRQRK